MNRFLYFYLLLAAFSTYSGPKAMGQCTYTARRSGNFFSAIWDVTGTSPACRNRPFPAASGSDIIIIDGFNVNLNQDYEVENGGSITVSSNGALVGSGRLTVGNGVGSQSATQLMIAPGITVDAQQIVVNNATVMVDATSTNPGTLATSCNLVLLSATILDNGIITVRGNLDLSGGGTTNTLCGSGQLTAQGCVFGGTGAVARLTQNCVSILPTPSICARGIPATGCPGASGSTAPGAESCDLNIPSTGQNCTALPVELILFTATPAPSRAVALLWITASEQNSASFAVERSADGVTFRAIHTLPAAGNTSSRTTYAWVDERPPLGLTYYRLRQVDVDGSTTFSPVRSLSTSHGGAVRDQLLIYPNPAHDVIRVVLQGPAAPLYVYDAFGRVVRTQPSLAAGIETELPLEGLPTGFYVVRCGALLQRLTVQ